MMNTRGTRVCVLCIWSLVGLLLWSCGPKRTVFSSDPSFPPMGKTPVKILLAAPLDSMDLSLARDDMISHCGGDPARALKRTKCVWEKGLREATHKLSKDTDLTSEVLIDASLYPPASEWIHYSADALSVLTFSIHDSAVVSRLRKDGFDFVVVPRDLSVRSRAAGGQGSPPSRRGVSIFIPPAYEQVYIETPVAVVDLERNAVVWTGVVSSSSGRQAPFRSSSIIETEAYDWLLELLAVLGRTVSEPNPRFEPCK